MLGLKISDMKNISDSDLINKQLKLKNPSQHNTKFETLIIFNCIHQTKSESKIYIFALCLSLFKALFLNGINHYLFCPILNQINSYDHQIKNIIGSPLLNDLNTFRDDQDSKTLKNQLKDCSNFKLLSNQVINNAMSLGIIVWYRL